MDSRGQSTSIYAFVIFVGSNNTGQGENETLIYFPEGFSRSESKSGLRIALTREVFEIP